MAMRHPVPWAVAMLAAAVAAIGAIGSDALWLVPLGRIVAHGHLPGSIPSAAAPTGGWHDVPAGAELVFWALYRVLGGLRGLVVAQSVAAAVAFAALAVGLRRQGRDGAAVAVAIVVLIGAIPAVVVVGVQLFSLALFSVLLLFLESEPRRLWLAIPLIAVWANLHGGVLTGLGLLACYVVLHRPRAIPVLAASTVAVFANPALWHTPSYYRAVFGSAVAREGKGMWAPLAATPFDLVLVVAAVVLIAAIARGRPRVHLWEAVALVGLAAGTVHASRTGAWFLFVAAYPAARGLRIRSPRPRLVAAAAVLLALLAIALLAKGPPDPGSTRLARLAAHDGRTVLADPILGQQVALEGGRIWVDNPVDAFDRSDQDLYLDWLDGHGRDAVSHAGLVLVIPTSKAGRRAAADPRLRRIAVDANAVLYRVIRGAGS
jgi:hypothetical protein